MQRMKGTVCLEERKKTRIGRMGGVPNCRLDGDMGDKECVLQADP